MTKNLKNAGCAVLALAVVVLAGCGGPKRCFFEGREEHRQRRTEVGLNRCPHRLETHGRHLVMQQLQLVNVGVWEEVAPHGEHLPEFNEGQAQFFDCLAHGSRRRHMLLAEQGSQEPVLGKYAQYMDQALRGSLRTGAF